MTVLEFHLLLLSIYLFRLVSVQGNTRFETICKGCDTRCLGCIVEDSTSVPTCATMFPHAKSESGTATIEGVVVDRGYWRAHNKSDNILSCYNADACLGGFTGDPGYCSDGYEGPCELPAKTTVG